MNNSVALIGGAGFIGTNLANYFTGLGYNVLVTSRSIIDNKRFDSKVRKVVVDANQTSKLIQAISGYENIIWLVNNLVPTRFLLIFP